MASPGANVTVLLVEDDDVEAERVTRAFQRTGTPRRIYRAWDGVDALALLRGGANPPIEQPVVILLDLKMPRMDGLQFLDELRGDPHLRFSIVFVLTTSQNEQDRLRAYDRHIAGYILKTRTSADFSEVVLMLDRYCDVVDFPQGDSL